MNKEYIRQIIRNNINEIIDENSCVFCCDITNEDLRKWFGKGKQGGAGGGGWDRYGSDGQKLGKCGDGKEGGAYAVCLFFEIFFSIKNNHQRNYLTFSFVLVVSLTFRNLSNT